VTTKFPTLRRSIWQRKKVPNFFRGDHIVPNFEEIWPSGRVKSDKGPKGPEKGPAYYLHAMQGSILQISISAESFFLKRLPGVGSEPGSSQFNLFSYVHHFTAEPQRLPNWKLFLINLHL
jgi:hypothetical protein